MWRCPGWGQNLELQAFSMSEGWGIWDCVLESSVAGMQDE